MIVRDLASQVQSLEDFLSAEVWNFVVCEAAPACSALLTWQVPPWKQDPSDLCAYLDAYMMAERPVPCCEQPRLSGLGRVS